MNSRFLALALVLAPAPAAAERLMIAPPLGLSPQDAAAVTSALAGRLAKQGWESRWSDAEQRAVATLPPAASVDQHAVAICRAVRADAVAVVWFYPGATVRAAAAVAACPSGPTPTRSADLAPPNLVEGTVQLVEGLLPRRAAAAPVAAIPAPVPSPAAGDEDCAGAFIARFGGGFECCALCTSGDKPPPDRILDAHKKTASAAYHFPAEVAPTGNPGQAAASLLSLIALLALIPYYVAQSSSP